MVKLRKQFSSEQAVMNGFLSNQNLIFSLAGVIFGTSAGFLIHSWWMNRLARLQRTVPSKWPLIPRPVTSSLERAAWGWMTRAFYDHAVMIKMPVTRFTLPQTKEQGLHWYKLLSGAYCTFTVVAGDGRVLGCVDVVAPLTKSKKSQILKESLLNQCGIGYVVVDATNLPDTAEIRAEFLGANAAMQRARSAANVAAVAAASHQLRSSLNRQRKTRRDDRRSAEVSRFPEESYSSEFITVNSGLPSTWQSNSFLTPLDSRKAPLR